MRLLHLTNFGSPYPGSFIPVIIQLMRRARERGMVVEVVFGPLAEGRSWLGELDDARIPWRIAPDVSRRTLSRWVGDVLDEASGPTILHTHFTRFDVPAAVAARRRPDTNVIWHFHTPLADSLAIRLRNRMKVTVPGRRVAAIVCVSSDLRERLIRRGAPPEKLHVLPNAIDTDRFPLAANDERRQARGRLGLPLDATVVLHLGWDWRRKGGDIFLDAVASLRKSLEEPLVGATVSSENEAGASDLPEGIVALAPTPDVQSLYAAADVFVSPSRAEGQPYAVMEALSCGTPVVASDIPGHSLVAKDLSACKIVPSEDPRGVAAAVQTLLARDATTTRADAAAAHEAMVTRFGVRAWSNKLLDCYERLAAEPRA